MSGKLSKQQLVAGLSAASSGLQPTHPQIRSGPSAPSPSSSCSCPTEGPPGRSTRARAHSCLLKTSPLSCLVSWTHAGGRRPSNLVTFFKRRAPGRQVQRTEVCPSQPCSLRGARQCGHPVSLPGEALCGALPDSPPAAASRGRALAFGATSRERRFTKCRGRRGEPSGTLVSLMARSLTPIGALGPLGYPERLCSSSQVL